jgi:hypothetical protein
MKRKMITLLAACIAYAASTSVASAFMQNWQIDLDGAGTGSPVTVTEFLNVIGNAFIVNTPVTPGSPNFTFSDNAFFADTGHDSSPRSISSSNELTATFKGTGTGTFGGSVNFLSGVLTLYSDPNLNYATATTGGTFFGANDGLAIAQFDVLSGAAAIGITGIPNGQITVSLRSDTSASATALGLVNGFRPGYFRDTTGNDLSIYTEILGFVTTNASQLQNPIDATLSGALADFSGLPVSNAAPATIVVSNNGQFRISAVPESGTLALIGAGLLSLTIFGKRHMKKEY